MKISANLILICSLILLPGCSTVAPWERGNLAKPQMAAEPNPMQRLMLDHAYSSREAGSAGAAGAGGGCGCY